MCLVLCNRRVLDIIEATLRIVRGKIGNMAMGRNSQLTRQIGEHLVLAKLGRLGYSASPFAGNVPQFYYGK